VKKKNIKPITGKLFLYIALLLYCRIVKLVN
jgi:hypothetical protein